MLEAKHVKPQAILILTIFFSISWDCRSNVTAIYFIPRVYYIALGKHLYIYIINYLYMCVWIHDHDQNDVDETVPLQLIMSENEAWRKGIHWWCSSVSRTTSSGTVVIMCIYIHINSSLWYTYNTFLERETNAD